MTEVSPQVRESARKIEQAVLHRLSELGQVSVAKALDVSEATVSRLKDGQIHVAAQLLAALGFRVVPEQVKCVDTEMLDAMCKIYTQALVNMDRPADLLLWRDAQ